MPNPCKNGHDRDITGINRWRQCRQCVRERLRAREQNRAQKLRTASKEPLRYPHPRPRVKPVSDGLESLYGPVPDLVPDAKWYDEVIVIRALNNRPTGRVPFPLEWAEILRRIPRTNMTDEDLSVVTRTGVRRISDIRKGLDERRSKLLATGGV